MKVPMGDVGEAAGLRGPPDPPAGSDALRQKGVDESQIGRYLSPLPAMWNAAFCGQLLRSLKHWRCCRRTVSWRGYVGLGSTCRNW